MMDISKPEKFASKLRLTTRN